MSNTIKKLQPPLLATAITLSGGVSAFELEEVVVTAQKREQSLQDVGIAVTAFTGDQLKELGYNNAQQVTAMSPGVTTIQPNGLSSYYVSVRGVGQNDFSGDQQESPVAIYVDEAYISAASGAGFQLFDVERTEVLRGPQGTLFGRNATGGLVHYITKKPSQEFEAYGEVTVGAYEQKKVEGAVGGGLTDSISGRFSFIKNEHDPYIKNTIGKDLNNGDDYAVRGQLLFDFNDDAQWLISARYAETDIDTGMFKHSSARPNAMGLGEDFAGLDMQGQGSPSVGAGTGDTTFAYQDTSSDPYRGAYNTVGYLDLETSGLTSNLSWDFESFSLTAITDYFHLKKDYLEDSDSGPYTYFNFFQSSDLDQYSQEIRINGETDTMRWVAGAFYLKIEGDFTNGGIAGNFFNDAYGLNRTDTINAIPELLGIHNAWEQDTESYAVFGQVEFDLTDELTLIAGLRWSQEEKDYEYVTTLPIFAGDDNPDIAVADPLGAGNYYQYNKNGGTASGVATVGQGSNPGEIDKDLVTAKLELDWRLNNDVLLYASYNRGIKGGGFNAPLDPTDLIDGDINNGTTQDMKFDEEVLDAFEIGFKSELFDGLARLNGAIYYYDYQDYQAFRFEGLTSYVFNTDATTTGAELELQATPADGLSLILGVGYIDNKVEDAYRFSGITYDRNAVMTPELNANAMVRYEWNLFSGTAAVQWDSTYMSEHFFQLKNAPSGTQSGYTLNNARISYTSADDTWTLAAFVNNVNDKEYRVMSFDLASEAAQGGLGLTESAYGTPRWWGVSFAYNWQ